MESFSLHHKNNESPSPAAGNHPQSLLRLRWSTDKPHTCVHAHTLSEFSHLIQLPVELGGSESVDLRKISSEQEHQAAVVDVQRVMVAVHLCTRKMKEMRDQTRATAQVHFHQHLQNYLAICMLLFSSV